MPSSRAFNAFDLLGITNRDYRGVTCVGYAHTKGRRCHRSPNQQNRADAFDMLARLPLVASDTSRLKCDLEGIAIRLLCIQDHRPQYQQIAAQWYQTIRNELRRPLDHGSDHHNDEADHNDYHSDTGRSDSTRGNDTPPESDDEDDYDLVQSTSRRNDDDGDAPGCACCTVKSKKNPVKIEDKKILEKKTTVTQEGVEGVAAKKPEIISTNAKRSTPATQEHLEEVGRRLNKSLDTLRKEFSESLRRDSPIPETPCPTVKREAMLDQQEASLRARESTLATLSDSLKTALSLGLAAQERNNASSPALQSAQQTTLDQQESLVAERESAVRTAEAQLVQRQTVFDERELRHWRQIIALHHQNWTEFTASCTEGKIPWPTFSSDVDDVTPENVSEFFAWQTAIGLEDEPNGDRRAFRIIAARWGQSQLELMLDSGEDEWSERVREAWRVVDVEIAELRKGWEKTHRKTKE